MDGDSIFLLFLVVVGTGAIAVLALCASDGRSRATIGHRAPRGTRWTSSDTWNAVGTAFDILRIVLDILMIFGGGRRSSSGGGFSGGGGSSGGGGAGGSW